jgi:K+-sensing histidine kinase KdpD
MRSQYRRTILWLVVLTLATAVLLLLRPQLDKAHVALAYLLVVLGASSRGGLGVGLGLAVLTFLCFNFFFLPPYHTFTLARRVDWLILGSYLITAAVAAALLSRAEREAAERIRLAAEAEHAAALRETDRLKDAVIAAVSHDLRTPLTSIKALAHDIASEGDERARVIGTEADRLNRYVAGLLDLSALNSGALRLNLEANTIEDVVGAAIGGVSAIIDGRELRTNLGEGEVLLARFDFVYTVRILSNLMENAHKYSPPGTAIEIDAARVHDTVEVAVSDRGRGIPIVERDRVFQPFYRPEGAAADGASTGLGLAIARRFAEAQGGTLRLEQRVGGGSTFVISLPAVELDPLSQQLL